MRKKLTTSLILLASAAFTWGQWTVEFTFDGGIPQEVFVSNLLETGTAEASVVNGMLDLQHGDPQEDTNNLWVMLPLSADLKAASEAVGGPVTVYFEMLHPAVGDGKAIVDVAWGLSNEDPDTVLETRYNVFNAMMRINSGTLGWELRDGGSYVPVTQLEADTPYKVWMVVDYTLNFLDVYIEGGQYTDQTNVGTVFFRVDPGVDQTVDYMAFGCSDGTIEDPKGIDSFRFDNVAIDTTAENLTTPTIGETPTWAGFTVDANGWVNTGDWLGYVNVDDAPWIWSDELQNWMYIEEANVGANGGWIFVVN